MKKFLSLALMGLLISASVSASSFTREDGTGGNVMLRNRKIVATGTYPGSVGSVTVPFVTMVDLNYGAPVVLVATTITSSAGNPVVVSGTATLGDQNVIGVAVMPDDTESVTAGSTVHVAMLGVALARVGYVGSVAKNTALCASATAGKLTPCAAVTPTYSFSEVSSTALVGKAIETKTLSGGDSLIRILLK